MKSKREGFGYNERLFSGGLRSSFHFARFAWFSSKIKELNCATDTVLELGCFDGKLIDFLPATPTKYIGFDKNWEGGLDMARERYKETLNFFFVQASSPEDMLLDPGESFRIAVSMETLEHVPPAMVDGYLNKIAQHLDGYFFVTVPNEKGIVFLTKWMAKKLLTKDSQHYSIPEVINATVGRMDRVDRREHKGFDYQCLLNQIEKYFDVISVSGHPFRLLPSSLCFGIGIVAKSKNIGA